MIKDLKELEQKLKGKEEKPNVCLVCAHDLHSLEAIKKAVDKELISVTLVGIEKKILELLNQLNFERDNVVIYNSLSDVESAKLGVELVKEEKVDTLMKGKIQTKDFLKAVVDSETGIKDSKVLSHVVVNELPNYHKLVATTDGGMVLYPKLEEKAAIIKNAVKLFNNIGYEKPNVAVLTAVEVVNPKMQETIDAKELKDMNFENCYVEGPISYDLTFSKEAAKVKGYESPVTENVDILVMPNITAGNILGKSMIYTAGGKMAGVVVGAKVPIILTSRASSAEEKYYSIILASLSKKTREEI